MIAMDFDGTLLTDDKKITERNREAVLAAYRKGVRIVPCSGRYEECMLPGIHTLDLFKEGEYFIASNGARIVEGGSDQEIHSSYVPKESIRKILDLGAKFEFANPQIYANNHHYVAKYVESSARYDKAAGKKGILVDSFDECMDMKVEKIVFAMMNEEENMPIIQEGMRDFLPEGIQMFRSAPFLLEFVDENAGKWGAVEYLCKRFGIDKSEVLSLGDSENDLSMITGAGYSGVPANADPLLIRAATYVSKFDNNNHAVADIIEHYFDEMGE